MDVSSPTANQIQLVTSFQDLISTPFRGTINAICWTRKLIGDFSEIINKIELNENIVAIDQTELLALQLSEQGQLAREILLNDFGMLKAQGTSPILNIIKCYERDDANTFLPTDVYSFHVDRSPVPTDTYLCTYHGEPSEILPNSQAKQKVLNLRLREMLKKLYHETVGLHQSTEEGFESFLKEHCFDLHYLPEHNAQPINLGLGNMWKLAVDHPESNVLPCIHRAPIEKNGLKRLLMIC